LKFLSKHISEYALGRPEANFRYYLTFKSIFEAENPKKFAITSLNVKIFGV
jgi:hypothetical protein